MYYDPKKIGERIRKERIEANLNQGPFAKELGFSSGSRQTVTNWERGERLPDFEIMLKMCKLFDCELGYLLCEQDCKTREATDVQAATGLTESAIRTLLSINKYNYCASALNQLLEHRAFMALLQTMRSYALNYNQDRTPSINREDAENLAKIFNWRYPNDWERLAVEHLKANTQMTIESTIMEIARDIEFKITKHIAMF